MRFAQVTYLAQGLAQRRYVADVLILFKCRRCKQLSVSVEMPLLLKVLEREDKALLPPFIRSYAPVASKASGIFNEASVLKHVCQPEVKSECWRGQQTPALLLCLPRATSSRGCQGGGRVGGPHLLGGTQCLETTEVTPPGSIYFR